MNVLNYVRRLKLYSSVLVSKNISQLYFLILRNIKTLRNASYFPVVEVEVGGGLEGGSDIALVN
jgi:nicotinate-nucleotide pyrophosphorylase